MSKYSYILLCAVLILLLFLGSVCASDDLNSSEVLDSQPDVSDLEITDGTFENIQTEIDNADDGAKIDLSGRFESTGSVIHVNKSLTIDGHKNTTLDAKKASGFFYLDNVSRLTVNGIRFINAEDPGDSVFTWVDGFADEYTFTDCEFQDNVGYFLHISSKKATFTGCSFTNNDAALYMLDSDDLTLRNCNFVKNTDQLISRAKTIDECTFQENYAYPFDLLDNVGSITNSRFIGNYYMGYHILISSVGYMYGNYFESNDAAEYLIANAGTVDNCVFVKNPVSIFNRCNALKNSRFENNKFDMILNGGTVTGCSFIGGKGVNSYIKASSITNSHFRDIKNCYISGKGLNVKGCDFKNIYGYVAASKIDKCSFTGCAMNVEASTLTNSRFTKNTFKTDRIDVKTVKNCVFSQNKCKTIMMIADKVYNSKFIKNVCNSGLMGVSKSVNKCKFEKNSFAKSKSGNLVGGPKLLKKCTFKYNTGKLGSLVIGAGTINGCTFKSNKVTNYGMGVVYDVKKVVNSKFVGNKAYKSVGGAIDDVRVVKKCTFKSNYALAGGAISTIGKFTIEKCVFEKNKVKHSASAIYLHTPYKTRIKGTIKSCKFIKNKSKGKIRTHDVPFKSYKKGTVFAVGDFKLKIKIKFKKCKWK